MHTKVLKEYPENQQNNCNDMLSTLLICSGSPLLSHKWENEIFE